MAWVLCDSQRITWDVVHHLLPCLRQVLSFAVHSHVYQASCPMNFFEDALISPFHLSAGALAAPAMENLCLLFYMGSVGPNSRHHTWTAGSSAVDSSAKKMSEPNFEGRFAWSP